MQTENIERSHVSGPSELSGVLAINDLYSDDGRCFYAKGWHDKQSFADKLTAWGEEGVMADKVRHCYGHFGLGRDGDGKPAQLFYTYDEPGRGRFMVTYWDTIG